MMFFASTLQQVAQLGADQASQAVDATTQNHGLGLVATCAGLTLAWSAKVLHDSYLVRKHHLSSHEALAVWRRQQHAIKKGLPPPTELSPLDQLLAPVPPRRPRPH